MIVFRAFRISVEQLSNEITALDTRIKKIRKQIELATTDGDIKSQMVSFLETAEGDVSILQTGMREIEKLRLQLSDFFCEDPGTFKIEECFKIFQNFCEKFKLAVGENDKRRVQEEQANLRKKLREEQLASRRRQAGTPVSDSENSLILDPSSYDVRGSPAMSRRRYGTYEPNGRSYEGQSPEITPNGSLRRRRSRALPDEDDGNLMEFLRSSGNCENGSRERKIAYGSLGECGYYLF